MEKERSTRSLTGRDTGFSPDDLLFPIPAYELMLSDITALEAKAIKIAGDPQSSLLLPYETRSAAICLIGKGCFPLFKSILRALRRQRIAQDAYRTTDGELAKMEATPTSPTVPAASVDEKRSELLQLRSVQKEDYGCSKILRIDGVFWLEAHINPALMNDCFSRLGVRDDSRLMFKDRDRFLVPDPERDAQGEQGLGEQVFVLLGELKQLLEDGKPADIRNFEKLMDKSPASLLAKTYQYEKAKTWALVHRLRWKNTVGTAKELVAMKRYVSLSVVQKRWHAYNADRKIPIPTGPEESAAFRALGTIGGFQN